MSRVEAIDRQGQAGPELLRDQGVVDRIRRNMGREDNTALLAVENLVHLLKTYTVMYDALTDMLAPFDLSLPQYNLLVILYTAPGHHLPMSEIGERMSVTRTNITKLVDCLERSGLVRRADWPNDRRVVLAELTAKGEALTSKVMPVQYENVRKIWKGMSEEDCLQLTHLLLKLRGSISTAMQEQPAGQENDGSVNAVKACE